MSHTGTPGRCKGVMLVTLLYKPHPKPTERERHVLNWAMGGQVPGRILIQLIPDRAVFAAAFLLWGFQCTFCSFLLELLHNLQVFCSLFVSKLLLQNCLPERTLSSFTGSIFKFCWDSLGENVIPESCTSQGCLELKQWATFTEVAGRP